MRDIENDAVRVTELAFEVDAAAALQLAVEAAAVLLHALAVLLEIVDDESHVVNAVEVLAALVAGGIFRMELEQRQVDDAIGEREAVAVGRLDIAHLLQAEGLLIELRRRLQLGNRYGDVAQLGCHVFSSTAKKLALASKPTPGTSGIFRRPASMRTPSQ